MIVTTKDNCAGQPRVDGTRITVMNILRFIASGTPIGELITDYNLTKEQIEEALYWSADYIENNFKHQKIQITTQDKLQCPICKAELIDNHYVDEERPIGQHRVFGVTCTKCGYEKWNK